jgi:hypothetical protein
MAAVQLCVFSPHGRNGGLFVAFDWCYGVMAAWRPRYPLKRRNMHFFVIENRGMDQPCFSLFAMLCAVTVQCVLEVSWPVRVYSFEKDGVSQHDLRLRTTSHNAAK